MAAPAGHAGVLEDGEKETRIVKRLLLALALAWAVFWVSYDRTETHGPFQDSSACYEWARSFHVSMGYCKYRLPGFPWDEPRGRLRPSPSDLIL